MDFGWIVKLIAGWRRFAPVVVLQVDDDLLKQQQEAYRTQGVDDDEQESAQQLKKKRKQHGNGEVRRSTSSRSYDRLVLMCLGENCRVTHKRRRSSV